MGLPNVDLFLVDALVAGFSAARSDLDYCVADVMGDRPAIEQEELRQYLNGLRVSSNLLDRRPEKTLSVLASWTLFDIPFPQIGVYLAAEGTNERFLGDYTGAVRQGTLPDGRQYQDQQLGYWATGQWQIDVVCATKPETVWLANLARRFVLGQMLGLDQLGVKEISLSLADIRPEGQQLPVPVYGRRLTLTAGRVAHTWWDRQYVGGTYAVGENTAMEALA